jgi:hypothetical protein
VDFQEHDDKHSDNQQRMKPAEITGFIQPSNKLAHEARRVKRRGRLEHDGELFTRIINGFHPIRNIKTTCELAGELGGCTPTRALMRATLGRN